MRLTIVADDGAVYTDTEFLDGITFTNVPQNFHALQWNGAKGWIEFKENEDGVKLENETITSLPSWANDCLTDMETRKQQLIAESTIPVVAPAGTTQG